MSEGHPSSTEKVKSSLDNIKSASQQVSNLHKDSGVTNTSVIWNHDGTHDAEWATLCMTVLLVGLLLAVLYSRMWKTKDDWVVGRREVPKDDIFTAGPELNIRQLIESKLKNLPTVVIKKKTKKKRSPRTIMKYKELSQIEERMYNSEGSGSEEELFIKHNGFR